MQLRREDLAGQREALTEDVDECSGGEQHQAEDGIKPKAASAATDMSMKPCLLITALLFVFGALSLSALYVAAAAFDPEPQELATASVPTLNATGPSRRLKDLHRAADGAGQEGTLHALLDDAGSALPGALHDRDRRPRELRAMRAGLMMVLFLVLFQWLRRRYQQRMQSLKEETALKERGDVCMPTGIQPGGDVLH